MKNNEFKGAVYLILNDSPFKRSTCPIHIGAPDTLNKAYVAYCSINLQ